MISDKGGGDPLIVGWHVMWTAPKASFHNPGAVMSTNIWIFKYSNKMAIKYYSNTKHIALTGTIGQHSFLRKESLTEVMLLAFVWNEGASWTARSNTKDRLHNWSNHPYIMGGHCLLKSKEHNIGDLNSPVPGDIHRDKVNKELGPSHTG